MHSQWSSSGRHLTAIEMEEMAQQSDPKVRAQRLRAYKLNSNDKVWVEIEPGEWRKLPRWEVGQAA